MVTSDLNCFQEVAARVSFNISCKLPIYCNLLELSSLPIYLFPDPQTQEKMKTVRHRRTIHSHIEND